MSFTAHLFDQNGDLHFAASADVKDFRIRRYLRPQRDVGAHFFDQAFLDMPRGDEFPVLGRRAGRRSPRIPSGSSGGSIGW
jgi:hypothetical protein